MRALFVADRGGHTGFSERRAGTGLRVAAVFALLALSPALADAQIAQLVPDDWPLKPSGLQLGDSFRLLFVTSTTRNGDRPPGCGQHRHRPARPADRAVVGVPF